MKLNIQVSGEGPNLVLIHGWAMNSCVWDRWLDELTKSYCVICVELPGHGESEFSQSWTLESLLEPMAEQLPLNFSVLGWSLGGMVALAFADKYPSRVNKLIMLTSSAKFTQAKDWPDAMDMATLNQFSQSLMDNPSATIRRFLLLQTRGMGESKNMNKWLKYCAELSANASLNGLKSGLDILQNTDLRVALQNISCPVLVLLGGKDLLIPFAVGAASLHINSNITLHVLEQASHVPFLSHQNEVTRELNQFVLAKGAA